MDKRQIEMILISQKYIFDKKRSQAKSQSRTKNISKIILSERHLVQIPLLLVTFVKEEVT